MVYTKRFNLIEITFNDDDSVKSYVVNQTKLDRSFVNMILSQKGVN